MVPRPEIIHLLDKKALDIVGEIKLNTTINPNYKPDEKTYQLIKESIEIYELAIIDLWKFAFDKTSENHERKTDFHKYCKECFYLLQVLPIPDKPVLKIKHVLKLLTYAYLGEKWEDMVRILVEDKTVWDLSSISSDWNVKLFSTIYLAILHLTKKENLEDLNKTSKLIAQLREEQGKFEKTYLDGIENKFKIGATYELVALYHLAKNVELLGEYMLQGTPNQILVMLEMNFKKARTYAQQGRQIELELILRMLESTFRKMVENSV